MGAETPKQFLELDGKAIILHTIDRFLEAIPDINLVLVIAKDSIDRWQKITAQSEYANIPIAIGGETRSDSVRSGLSLVEDHSIVAVHDAVRPFVSTHCIQTVMKMAENNGAAIPVVKIKDSIRKLDKNGSIAVDRNEYRTVQTPQCFQTNILKEAYEKANADVFSDDATVVELSGIDISLVEGNLENIKITSPEDLKIAQAFLKTK